MDTLEIKQQRAKALYGDLDLLVEEYRVSLSPAEFSGTIISYLTRLLLVCSEGNFKASMEVIEIALKSELNNYRKNNGEE